jgi:hypothetical protein
MTPLPISVLIPTFNCAEALPGHLESVHAWAKHVEEIVVVDSFSDDGTMEVLRKGLPYPHVRFFEHPRGLYQSWNFGIQQLRAKYAYISTTGDTITAKGLEHLAATADKLEADVVISRPEFVAPNGHKAEDRQWPIHNLLRWRPMTQPAVLEPWHVFLLATLDIPEGILGSSASNLYRTATLQRFPFPTDFGHAGDTAWGIRYAFQISLAVTPEKFSRFLLHAPTANLGGDKKKSLASQMFDLARETANELQKRPGATPIPAHALPLLNELPAELQKLRELQDQYDKLRHESTPWIMRAQAWKARAARNRQRAAVRKTKTRICQAFGFGNDGELWSSRDN